MEPRWLMSSVQKWILAKSLLKIVLNLPTLTILLQSLCFAAIFPRSYWYLLRRSVWRLRRTHMLYGGSTEHCRSISGENNFLLLRWTYQKQPEPHTPSNTLKNQEIFKEKLITITKSPQKSQISKDLDLHENGNRMR